MRFLLGLSAVASRFSGTRGSLQHLDWRAAARLPAFSGPRFPLAPVANPAGGEAGPPAGDRSARKLAAAAYRCRGPYRDDPIGPPTLDPRGGGVQNPSLGCRDRALGATAVRSSLRMGLRGSGRR